MRRCMLLTLALLSLAFAPVPLPRDRNHDDRKRLQGEWALISLTFEGKPQPHGGASVIFSGGQMTQADGSGRCEVTLDANASPKGMELVWGPKEIEPMKILAVYDLQGDALRICYYSAREGRPKDLNGKGTMHLLHVYRREKR